MTCKQLQRALAENRVLSPEEQQHVDACPGCRALLEAFNSVVDPEPQHLERIQEQLIAQLTPVSPRPPAWVLVIGAACLVIASAIVISAVTGHAGYFSLNMNERLIYFTALLGAISLLSAAVVQELIPGSRQRVSPVAASAGAITVVALAVSVLFRNFNTEHFAQLGLPCFEIGSAVAFGCGMIAWRFARNSFSFVASPLQSAAMLGFFAGSVGVAVLALRCPLKNSAHILVWHLGSMIFAASIAIVFCGLWLNRSRQA